MVYYVNSTGTDNSINDCTLAVHPCQTISAAHSSIVARNEVDSIILVNPLSDTDTIDFTPSSRYPCVDLLAPLTITGNLDKPIPPQGKVLLQPPSTRTQHYVVGVNASVLFENFRLHIKNAAAWFEAPTIYVASSGSLALSFLIIAKEQAEEDATTRSGSIIDSTEGTLKLIGTHIHDFDLRNTSLLKVSVEADKFSMECGEFKDEDEDEPEIYPCRFQDVQRSSGSGCIFEIYLTESSVFNLQNAKFQNCKATQGATVYLKVQNQNAQYTFSNLEFSAPSVVFLYISFPSAPELSKLDYFFDLLYLRTSNEIVIEYPQDGTTIIKDLTELPTSLLYVGSSEEPDSTCGQTQSTACVTIAKSNTATFTYVTSSPQAISEPISYSSTHTIEGFNTNRLTVPFAPSVTSSLLTGMSGSVLIFYKLELKLMTYVYTDSSSQTQTITEFTSSPFTSAGALTFIDVSFTRDSTELKQHLIDAHEGTLNLTSCSFNGFYTQQKALLHINPTNTAFLVDGTTFTSIARATGNGAVLEETVSSGAFTLHGMRLESCTTTGSGGAVALTITSGDVLIDDSVHFSACSVSQPAGATDPFGTMGGALYVAVSGGTLRIDAEDGDSNPSSPMFRDCNPSTVAGGCLHIKTSNAPTIVLNYLFFSFSTYSTSSVPTGRYGGALCITGSGDATLSCSHLKFINCTAERGGAIYYAATIKNSVTFDHIAFESCYADYGAAMRFDLSDYPTTLTFSDIDYKSVTVKTLGSYLHVSTPEASGEKIWTKMDRSRWESTWEGLVHDAVPNDHYFYCTIGTTSYQIEELEPSAVLAAGWIDSTATTCTLNNPCTTLAKVLATSTYTQASYVKIYVYDTTITENKPLSITGKTHVNVTCHSSSPPTVKPYPFTTTAEGDVPWTDVIITIGCEVIFNRINFDLSAAFYTLPSATSQTGNNPLFSLSSGASLTLRLVSVTSSSDYRWQCSIIKAASGTLILTGTSSKGTQFSRFSLATDPLLEVNPAKGGFVTDSCVFQSIYRNSGGGSVISTTLSAGHELSITHATFSDCSADGDGGALHIVVAGGALVLGSSEDDQMVKFQNCRSNRHGGAIYIDAQSGSFQFGSIAHEVEDPSSDTPRLTTPHPLYCTSCTASQNGGSVYISLRSWSLLSLGAVCLELSTPRQRARQGESLYICSPDEDMASADWPSLRLFTAFLQKYTLTFADYKDSNRYIVYDETNKRSYDLCTIGQNKLTVCNNNGENFAVDTEYCGTTVPCTTLSAALKSQTFFIHKPTIIELAAASTYTPSDDETLTILYPVTIQPENPAADDETTPKLSRNYTIFTITWVNFLYAAAPTTIKDISFIIDTDISPVFTVGKDGTLTLINVLIAASSSSKISSPFNTSSRPFSASGCEFVQMYLGDPLFKLTHNAQFTVTNTNFTNLHGGQRNNGNAIFAYLNGSEASLSLSSVSFHNCTTDYGNGGAVRVSLYEGSLSITHTSFTNCNATADSFTPDPTYTVRTYLSHGGYGGAVYLDIQQNDTSKLTLDFDSVSFSDNSADCSGDSVYVTVSNEDILSLSAFKDLVPQSEEEGMFTYAVANTSYPTPTLASLELPAKVHPSPQAKSGMSTGSIVGIVIGCVAVVAIIVAVLLVCIFCSKCLLHKKIHGESKPFAAEEEMKSTQYVKSPDADTSSSSSTSPQPSEEQETPVHSESPSE